ncbi:metal ABC transporter solute-binding protein, Zn/Mn family [Labilibacter marinus]|uniref:metal ABC transporter solute-binding protein, Zn/Mn family n=1 Tax=Labilibacter marinus TaxID=1477105 RepID=UPI00094F6E50|nr:zinc ABC transporter substrate-binding protein [Labilibacter marinus]
MKYNQLNIITALSLIITILLGSCNTPTNKGDHITVSILPQKYLVDKLMGDSISVNVLIPPGSSPATYSPSPLQIKSLSSSKVYLRIGHIGFEQAWMDRIIDLNPNLKISDTSTGIDFIRGEDHVHGDHVHKGGIDPHVWTSPKTMLQVLENTTAALIKSFPKQEASIRKNNLELKGTIQAINEQYIQKCDSFKNKSFYIFHPAYTYLAQNYGLNQISIEHKGKEPSAQWIKKLIDNGEQLNIKAIFIQEEFDKRNAEIIASELNVPVIQVNPLSLEWDSEMTDLLTKLEGALN